MKNGFSSFRIFACLLWCIWKNIVFHPTNWWRHLLLFFCLFLFSCLFVCLFVCLFLKKKSLWNNPFSYFELFFEIPCLSFSLFLFFLAKNQPNKLHFFNFFLFHIFSFIIFHFFLSILFSLIIFPFIFFVHPFVHSSPFSLLSFSVLSLFLHLSVSLFFLCIIFPYLFFAIAFFAYLPFVLKHSSFLPFDLDLFVFLLHLYPFFLHLRLCFFLALKKVQNILWSIFWRRKCLSYFQNHPVIWILSRVFSSCPMFSVFSRIFIITYLLFWVLFKKSFWFWKTKNHRVLSQFYSFWKTSFFPECLPIFAMKPHLHAWSSKNTSSFVCVFKLFWKISSLFFVSVFFFKKKTPLKSNWFSLLFSLYFFLLFRSLFVSSRYVYSPLCYSSYWKNFRERKSWKMVSPIFTFFIILLWRAEKKKMFFIQQIGKPTSPLSFAKCSRKDLPFFSSFSIFFHSIQAFLRTSRPCCVFYLVFIFRKNLPFFKKKVSHEKHSLFFFHHFLILFITFRTHHCFPFPFLLDLLFSWSPSSSTHFSCTSLSVFFEQLFLLQIVSKKKFQIFHYTCMGYLLMSFLLTHFSKSKKKLVRSFPFSLGVVSCFFVFACFVFLFSIFLFLFYSRVLKHFSSLFSFLNVVCSLLVPFSVYLLKKKNCLVWTSSVSHFKNFSFYILSLLHKKNNVFWIVSFCNVLFLVEKRLVLQREKCAFVFSLTFFLEPLSFFVWFFLISFATRFLRKNILKTSLFPPFVHSLSICSLFVCTLVFVVSFAFFLLFLNFFCLFIISVSLCKTLCQKYISFETAAKLSFSFFFPSKNTFSLFPFVLSLFYIDLCSMFFCVFCVLKKRFLILFHSPFFCSSFQLCFSSLLHFYVSKI